MKIYQFYNTEKKFILYVHFLKRSGGFVILCYANYFMHFFSKGVYQLQLHKIYKPNPSMNSSLFKMISGKSITISVFDKRVNRQRNIKWSPSVLIFPKYTLKDIIDNIRGEKKQVAGFLYKIHRFVSQDTETCYVLPLLVCLENFCLSLKTELHLG